MPPRKELGGQKTTGSSFLHRQFTALSLVSRESSGEPTEELRGPLGLTVLHEPAEPLIDFIFVHGLRGGSRKTWSKTSNPAHFWPKAWLPLEPHFRNVRIHTFGYNSDWGERKGSSVTVHDFGQALLADLYNSPHTGGPDNDTPIVFVAHSMGGIVVKKVLILAKQDPSYHKVAARIHSMFFLATPHRGSDSAPLLRNVLQLSGAYGSKAYVENLVPNSEAIHLINDQFRHVYQDVQLWSFFETMKTSLGLIVEKDSAILGLPGERVQLLNADHRHVCKFENPSDSDYCTLRNAFSSAISSIENTWFSTRREEHQTNMKRLSEFFGYLERPDADLAMLSDHQIQGSCEWLTDKPAFHGWREGFKGLPSVFWLRGDPATGKSTAVAHVIKYLENSNVECSFFFFKHNIKGKSTVAEMLCSLAWQMASANSIIRRKLLSMQDDGITIDLADPATLWRTIFLSRIFRTELRQPHFWIIDALDESADFSTLCHFLAKVDRDVRLRVFISSRPDLTMERLFSQEKISISVESTSLETSLEDMKMYLDVHAEHLPVGSDYERDQLISQILEKSNGNFLWTSLVIQELEDTFSQERIVKVLRSVPKGIDDLYSRIIRTITASNSNAEVSKSILRWISCASHPLTVDELREAVALDIQQTVPQLEKNAGPICGNLVYVDNASRVHVKHQTVKDYLFRNRNSSDSGLGFDRAEEHGRIAEICLKFLCSDVMKTVRYRRTNMNTRESSRPFFTAYAISYFSGHLSRASSSDDRLLIMLNKFFLTNSLTWIELIAAQHDLSPLTETAKNLKAFMERRAKYRSPLGKEVQNVLEWVDDLIRLVAQFGRALLATPSAIHFLIPSVCPPGSIIFRNFAKYPRPLRLVGLSQTSWDDRLCCIPCAQLRVLSIACDVNKFAIGLNNGSVHVYHEKTFQKIFDFAHGEPTRCLAFSRVKGLLAAAGRKKVNVWDLGSGCNVWNSKISDQPLAFEFTEDDSALMAGTRDNKMIFWNAVTGKVLEPISAFSDFDEDKGTPFPYNQPPIHAAFSPGLGLLGVAYRMRPITFWETEQCGFAGQYHKTGASYHEPFVHAFIFNPVPDICLAAVAFQDGDLAVFDPWSQNTQAMVHCDCSCLAASPNGTILASGDGEGVIKLFDFETLRLLYQINSHEENIRSISFSTNGLRFYDIRGDHCNVWEPSVLVRRVSSGDDSSVDQSDRVADEPHFTTARASDQDQEITALVAHHDGDFIFCGFESGAVKVYSTVYGTHVHGAIEHPDGIAILLLHWNEDRNLLASVDRTGCILIHQLRRSNSVKEPFIAQSKIFECTSPSAVQQLLLDPCGKRMLLAHSEQTELWDLELGKVICEHSNPDSPTLLWRTHPHDPKELLLIRNGTEVSTYSWKSLCMHAKPKSLVDSTLPQDLKVIWARTSSSSQNICAMLSNSRENGSHSILCVYPCEQLLNEEDAIRPIAAYNDLAKTIKAVIGCFKALLIFLNHEDWVCSLNIDNWRQNKSYTKHFYIPQQWQGSGVSSVQMLVTKRGSVVLVSMDELAVFHNGLDFEEHVEIPTKVDSVSPKLLQRPAFKKGKSSPL